MALLPLMEFRVGGGRKVYALTLRLALEEWGTQIVDELRKQFAHVHPRTLMIVCSGVKIDDREQEALVRQIVKMACRQGLETVLVTGRERYQPHSQFTEDRIYHLVHHPDN